MVIMENIGLIIAIVGVGISMVGVMLALFLWNRGESNSDRRYHNDSIERLRDDIDRLQNRLNNFQRKK